MKMNRTARLLAATAILLGAASNAHAALIDAPVPADLVITHNGFEWVWAGPCSPVAPSCGEADMSYQGGQGWRIPTPQEMTLRPDVAQFGTSASFKCASAYFSTFYSHCDYINAEQGIIYNVPGPANPGGTSSYSEFWAIRGAAAPAAVQPVPTLSESALMALAASCALLGGAVLRRRNRTID